MTSLVQRKSPNEYLGNSENQQKTAAYNRSSKFKEQPPKLKHHKKFVRMVIISAVLIIVYLTNRNKEKISTLAGVKEFVPLREHKIPCNEDSFSESKISCIASFCKRFVTDNLIGEHEISQLQDLSRKFFDQSDDNSNIHCLNSNSVDATSQVKSIQPKIIDSVAQRFEIAHNSLYLSKPTCFVKITNVTNEHSESFQIQNYDKATHKHVQYSVLIFLGSFLKNHNGGRFFFIDVENKKRKNIIVDPKPGRVLIYSSGSENTHFIENVINGQLLFIKLSLNCNQETALLLK